MMTHPARVPHFDGSVGTAVGFTVAVLVTLGAVVGGDSAHPGSGLVALAVGVALVAMFSTLSGAVFTAALCWGCYAGFLLGRHGVLVFDRASAVGAGVLAGVAVLFAVFGGRGRALLGRAMVRR
jgi:hypothetical protein